jgi:hypothetical protein
MHVEREFPFRFPKTLWHQPVSHLTKSTGWRRDWSFRNWLRLTWKSCRGSVELTHSCPSGARARDAGYRIFGSAFPLLPGDTLLQIRQLIRWIKFLKPDRSGPQRLAGPASKRFYDTIIT